MTQILLLALLVLWLRYPYYGLAMFATYIAYAKPDLLPIAAIISLYLCYKVASHLVKSLWNENIIKH